MHTNSVVRRVALGGLVLLILSGLVGAAERSVAYSHRLFVTNPLAIERGEEVIEIPIAEVIAELKVPVAKLDALIAEDTRSGHRIPSQIYGDGDHPQLLLLLVRLGAHQSVEISFVLDSSAVPQKALVFGREAIERKDDYAWENEEVTYRVYGPALEASGEITSGIDVWSKRVPNLVIDSFYKRDAEGARTHNSSLSYHKDNGVGLDSYLVGPTRGCGGTAIWADHKLYVSNNYTALKTLSNGPIRYAFELSYAPWSVHGRSFKETKRITLDAGSHLNKIASTFVFEGAGTVNLAAGIAVHPGADTTIPIDGQVASVWDTPQDATAGRIATGLVALPREKAKTEIAAGHALLIFERHSGEPIRYFAGSGWSKADIPTQAAWNAYLESFLTSQEHPLTYHWSK